MTRKEYVSRTCFAVFLFSAAKAAAAAGKKADSRAEARFASWAPVHLDSRWRGVGVGAAGVGVGVVGVDVWGAVMVEVVVVVGRGFAIGAWMFGIDGCFNNARGGAFVVAVVVIVGFRDSAEGGRGGGGGL